jgi:DNA-binding CsgD family transcriptional regulator
VLDALGLSAHEAAIYLILLTDNRATGRELQARVGSAFDISLCLQGLLGRGLIRRLPGPPVQYEPLPPAIAIDGMLIEHAAEFQRLREAAARVKAQLATLHRSTEPSGLVEVVSSMEEAEHRLIQLQRASQRQVRAFDRPPFVRPRSPVYNPVEVDELLPKGIEFRVIYDAQGVQYSGRMADLLAGIAAGEQARVLPDLPTKLFIFDDTAALLPLAFDVDETNVFQQIVVHRSGLLCALIALFEAYWARALPLRLDDDAPSETANAQQPTGMNAQIMGLVAAGLTDETIARQLGVSRSTIQRRIRELLDLLGARTRFQAGVQASKRGWL